MRRSMGRNKKSVQGVKTGNKRIKEMGIKYLFFVCALASVAAVLGILGYILYGSVPAFRQIGFFQFIFGNRWLPSANKFGIFPMLVNSVLSTLLAVLIGGTVGVFTAVFLVFWCPDKLCLKTEGKNRAAKWAAKTLNRINLRAVFDQVIQLLAGIPSIVYGLFGISVLVPTLEPISGGGTGKGLLACGILLAIMIVPTVTALSKNALEAVPKSYYEGALALGNTKAQAVFRAVFPAARSGILSALILGIGRAMGEAMAVIWVSGNRALFPSGLFTNIRTLTVNVVMEMGYAELALHRPALIATGFILLLLVLAVTLSLNLIPKEYKGKKGTRRLRGEKREYVFEKRTGMTNAFKGVSIGCALLVLCVLIALVGYIVGNGIKSISFAFFTGEQSLKTPTFFPALLATLELIAITLAIALPLGIGAAIFLVEYSKSGSRLVKIIRTFIDTLAGVPSIVFGLFGMLFFCYGLGLGTCVLSGALTLVTVVLPTVIRATEESLRAVPNSLREASYGLGAGKVRTIFQIVLPSAFAGIATSAVLSVGRILGETAALIFTMGTSFLFHGNPMDGAGSLAVQLYTCANEGLFMDEAYAISFLLLLVTFVLNIAVYFLRKKVQKKR